MIRHNTTIAAIATPHGQGGIGIVKISGTEAVPIAASVFRKSVSGETIDESAFKSHRLYHGHIVDPIAETVLDEVLLSVMRAPRSYTREDIVEINAHSGPLVLSRILDLVLSRGAALAEPGEFTKRAFLNGRIDLTQAEGVMDLIAAQTERSLKIAAAQLHGGLGRRVLGVRENLIEMLAHIEAEIDFPDDVDGCWCDETALETLQHSVVEPLVALMKGYMDGHVYRDGVRIAVVGRPNVGKSSVVNRMIQKDRIIVTPIPGTTRDLIEERMDIHGIPAVISDTAGLHKSKDPIESIGMEKTRNCIVCSDLVLFVVDAGSALSQEDMEIFDTVKEKDTIVVLNKVDLLKDGQVFTIPESWKFEQAMTSALYNQGIDSLKSSIAQHFVTEAPGFHENRMVPSLRHKNCLERSLDAVRCVENGLRVGLPMELMAIDLRNAMGALDEILGNSANDRILDEIFTRFCIGK